MSAMVEDALKSTRTLHRLIITVSLVTLVFGLSLDLPREKVVQRDAFGALIESDFQAYDKFVASRVEEFRLETLKPIGESLNKTLEAGGYLVFDLEDLGEAFASPLHVGRVLTEELVFADMTGATLTSLEALNVLALESDVQIVIPRMAELTGEIERFLHDNPKAGQRLSEIRVGINDYDFVAESFLPGDETFAGLYFELVDAVRTAGAPVFSANFSADVVTLPDSSFLDWVTRNDKLTEFIAIEGDQITFLPGLRELPAGFREEKLGLLFRRLSDEIAQAGPEKQSATILGTQVPGLLVVIASPLALLVLGYYFANHTGHLARLTPQDPASFQNFAWMPLALGKELRFHLSSKAGAHFGLPVWVLETLVSTIILPVASLGILYWQLSQFGQVGLWASIVIIGAIVGIISFGALGLRHIAVVRASRSAV